MNKLTGGLNPAQQDAVETLSGPILILAGAGSGKTRVLTHRIANLIAHGVQPHQILAVTFTNKAAREMRERLWRLVLPSDKDADGFVDGGYSDPPRNFMPYMGTFHGICIRILRIEAIAAGLDPNFTIYDSDDQIALIRRIMKEAKLSDDKKFTPKFVHNLISGWKNEGLAPDEIEPAAYERNKKFAQQIYVRYEAEKTAANALDFDDLLIRTLAMFMHNRDVRAAWQDKFKHILIDEYQDTNSVQYKLVKILVNADRNICVVGDDWQSIYSWRGADINNILSFEKDFPGAKVIKLEQNYRSTGSILTAAQNVIQHNAHKKDKELFTEAGEGEQIEIKCAPDETAEATYVASQIAAQRLRFGYKDMAILYRTNAQSYAFEKALLAMKVPYKIIGGVRFYDRKEVKDVLAILHVLANPNDRVSIQRITKNVLSGVGDVSLERFFEALSNQNFGEGLNFTAAAESLKGKAKIGMMRLANFIEDYAEKVGSITEITDEGEIRVEVEGEEIVTPSELIANIVRYFDFAGLLHAETEEGEERMQNLVVLASNAEPYNNLADFLADAALFSSADETTSDDAVSLMTLHAAKGLEFPVVFMVGMEEGLFPSSRAIGESFGSLGYVSGGGDTEELEEERRLAYVGITRAMKKLYMTYATSRYSFGSRSYNMPSRFIKECAPEYQEPSVGGFGVFGGDPDGEFGNFSSNSGNFGVFGGDPDGEFGGFDNFDSSDPFPDDLPTFDPGY